MTKDELLHELTEAGIEALSTGILAYVYANFPFFSLPIIKNITSLTVTKIIRIGFELGELNINYLLINESVTKEQKAFENAAIHDKEVQINGSVDEKEASRKAKMDAFKAFAKLHPLK